MSAFIVPALLVSFSWLLLFLPSLMDERERTGPDLVLLAALLAVGVGATEPAVAAVALSLSSAIHAWRVRGRSRDGALLFTASSALTLVVGVAFLAEVTVAAFTASMLAIALRAGAVPVHLWVSSLIARAPTEQIRQLGSLIPLVFLHLRFVDHHPIALAAAGPLVVLGALSTLLAAWSTLAARDLRGFVRGATFTHGGMLVAAVSAAGGGGYAASLFAAITLGLALGGLVAVSTALEDRAGSVTLRPGGGRARAFPLLSASFLAFGLSGVAAPGTAGFIADDLLLHVIGQFSVAAVAMLVLASAMLAIATMRAYSAIFLGKPTTSAAPDLEPRERWGVAAVVVLLLALGLFPRLLTEPANALLGEAAVLAP